MFWKTLLLNQQVLSVLWFASIKTNQPTSSLCERNKVSLEIMYLHESVCPWKVWNSTKTLLTLFQKISNKNNNCCSSAVNNNCVKICDNQSATIQEKEKEILMKEQGENYQKFRQLLDYDDVSSNLRRDFIFIIYFSGTSISSIQSVHPQRVFWLLF